VIRRVLLGLGLALPAGCGPAAPAPAPADLVIVNARIYTMDPRNPVAEAIAIRGDRIAMVGSRWDADRLEGPSTRVIDATGDAIVPGLHDAHGHVLGLGAARETLDLQGTASYARIVEMVGARAARARPGEWITGRGWDQNDWPEAAWPTHEALSAVSPDNPVYLTRVDGHAGLANRRAMQAAGLAPSSPDPPGGRIIRGPRGEPTGVLIDRAQALVTSTIPPLAPAQVEAQLLAADAELHRLGLTTVHDAGVGPETLEIYQRLVTAGRLKTRVYAMLRGSLQDLAPVLARGPVTDDGSHRLAARAVKLVADGALGSRGAALLEPYEDEPSTAGLLTLPPEDVYAQVLAASKAGFQPAVHAIGDRAARLVLDVFERVQREVPDARALRMRVEHAQILDAAEIPRFSRLGVIASMQATHATSDMPWVPARIGLARAEEGAYVWRKLLDAGAVVANGSDFPVEDPNPLLGFYAAVTRQDVSGRPAGGWMPHQRMSREEALRSFTIGAAYAAHAESVSGALEAGKLADLVVLSKDIMRVPPGEIPTTVVRMTMIGGEIVYERR
jgi:hypothetical protein